MFTENYQIIIIKNTYDVYEKSSLARKLLSSYFATKLRGYKTYFKYGVLPINEYDFFSDHVLLLDKATDQVISGFKVIKRDSCKKMGKNFPVIDHLIGSEKINFPLHIKAIEQWIKDSPLNHTCYTSGLTIDPLIAKQDKRNILDLMFSLFYLHFKDDRITHHIHGISKTYKLNRITIDMGYTKLHYEGDQLDTVQTKNYDNVESYIETIENLSFNLEYINKATSYQYIWNQRIEINEKIDRYKELDEIA